jgi:chitinase
MKSARRHRLALALAGGLWFGGAAMAETQPVIVAYFQQWGVYEPWNYHVTNLPADRLTHVNYAFAQPVYNPTSDTAALVSYDLWADTEMPYPGDVWEQPLKGSFNQLRKLKQRYPHLRTLISAGGWTLSDAFSDIAASSNARQSFAVSCVSFVTNYGFDGVDLDWEFPVQGGKTGIEHRPEDADNFVLLAQALRGRLDEQGQADGRSYLLTMAADGDPRHLGVRYRIGAMAPSFDWLNVMTYNFAVPADRKTGHNAPLYPNPLQPYQELTVDSSLNAYRTNGVPRQQLVMGLPFYGHGYKDVSPTNNGLFQLHGGPSTEGSWEPGRFDYRDLRDGVAGHAYLHDPGFGQFWDTYCLTPHLYNPTSRVVIAYDDERSIGRKAEYACANALRGVMIWPIDADTVDSVLLRSIFRVLYPVRMRYDSDPAHPPGVSLSWQGWTGQLYTVRVRSSLLDGGWTDCQTLIDGMGNPVTRFAGADQAILAIDTNAPFQIERFYDVAMTATNSPN